LVGGGHILGGYASALAAYAVQEQATDMTRQAWLAGGWRDLPARRIDLLGETEEPLVLQWAGEAPALRDRLLAGGWQAPVPWTGASAGRFLNPTAPLEQLPPLPLMHNGRMPLLVLTHAAPDATGRLVLRAWPTDYLVDGTPLLVAAVTREVAQRPWRLLTILDDVATPVPTTALAAALGRRVASAEPSDPGLPPVLLATSGP
jgi:undecaprenyl-diphosphatase